MFSIWKNSSSSKLTHFSGCVLYLNKTFKIEKRTKKEVKTIVILSIHSNRGTFLPDPPISPPKVATVQNLVCVHVTAFWLWKISPCEISPLWACWWSHPHCLHLGSCFRTCRAPSTATTCPQTCLTHLCIWQRNKTGPPLIKAWTGQCPLDRAVLCCCGSSVALTQDLSHFSFDSHNSPVTPLFTDEDTEGHTINEYIAEARLET